MSQLDLFYRAFKEYRAALQKEHESKLLRDELSQDTENDKVSVTQVTCSVDEDWVAAIEHGLVYIGKAIDEERQFIRSEGEVQPIEKVRSVSRETAEHLARHSNLITRAPKEGEDLLPEKLFTVERLNNYAVYENRFLYMVLCMLNDFISLRYNRIIRETNTYRGEAMLHKEVTSGKRRVTCEVTLRETSDDDPYLRSRNQLGEVLGRLERLQRTVYFYLRTPLMSEVAKADKLKPPITKTNVLRMDKNFKEVVVLYEYLLAYTRDGFTISREERTVDLRARTVAEEFAEPVLLLSFLTYEHGMGLEDALRKAYEAEENRRREEEQRALQEQLAAMRSRLRAREVTPEEYILLLEKRVRELEKEGERFAQAQEQIAALEGERKELAEQLEKKDEEIAALNEAHAEEIAQREEQADALRSRIDKEAAEHAAAIAELTRVKTEEIDKLNERSRMEIERLEGRIRETRGEKEALSRSLDERNEQYALLHARLTALRREHGLMTELDDRTSEAAFNELEHELEVLAHYVRGEWTSAKRLLRREILGEWLQNLRASMKRGARKQQTEPPAQEPETAAPEQTEISAAQKPTVPAEQTEISAAQKPTEAPEQTEISAADAENREDGDETEA